MEAQIVEKAKEVRAWLAGNVDKDDLSFPDEDATWEFITKRWPQITPHQAEAVLGEAMKPIADRQAMPAMKV